MQLGRAMDGSSVRIESLSKDERLQYELYVCHKVERSMQAAAAGRVARHQQVKKRLSRWLAR